MCDAKNGTEVWKPIDALNIDRADQSLLSPDEQKSYELIVKNLDNSKSFKFRVIAVNSIGPGKPSRSSQPVTPGKLFTTYYFFGNKWMFSLFYDSCKCY